VPLRLEGVLPLTPPPLGRALRALRMWLVKA
jgi:hypothetical protein